MLLEKKNVVVYGASGSIGATIARRAAREGARVFLAARDADALERVVADIRAEGGEAGAAAVDALDERAVGDHLDAVLADAGRLDAVVNAVGRPDVQGIPLLELPADDFMLPIEGLARCQFVTTQAAGRRMVDNGGGVVVTLSASPAALPGTGMGGFGVACASVESLTRHFAGELGPRGVRVVCVRPDKIADDGHGMPEEFFSSLVDKTLLGRLPTLEQVAATVAFVASDGAAAITGTVVNMTCGTATD